MLSKLFYFIFMVFISCNLFAAEQVVLQLKWEHQYQFAGYYAAKWQGFYEEVGLDVEIRFAIKPDKSIISPSAELKKGNAQFAIGALDILIGKDEEMAPVILASIFQQSPTAIFSLQKTDISNIEKLSQLRIAATESDFAKREIEALFRSHGYDLTKINFVDQPVTIDTLIDNKADAIITYEISAKFSAKEKNIRLNKLSPADLGLEFYGDSLYEANASILPDTVIRNTVETFTYSVIGIRSRADSMGRADHLKIVAPFDQTMTVLSVEVDGTSYFIQNSTNKTPPTPRQIPPTMKTVALRPATRSVTSVITTISPTPRPLASRM